jgi:hypothetical protein
MACRKNWVIRTLKISNGIKGRFLDITHFSEGGFTNLKGFCQPNQCLESPDLPLTEGRIVS